MRFINRLIEFLVEQSKKEHSPVVRTMATIFGATLFIAGIPLLILWADKSFNSGLIMPVPVAHSASLACFIIGIPWVFSAVAWQLIRGKGTPVPIVPTKHFLQNGPYRYVRNPMMLGFFLYLFGWVFLFNCLAALGAAALMVVLLLMEIKFIEEPELTKRFGDAYREYKKVTPFIFPKWVKKTNAARKYEDQ